MAILHRFTAVMLLAGQLPSTNGWSQGFDNCNTNFPSHGVNNKGQAAGFKLVVNSTTTGKPVTSWTSGQQYYVYMWGQVYRGLIGHAFRGAAASVTDFAGEKAGTFAPLPGDVWLRSAKFCDGAITVQNASNKWSATWLWNPPAAGYGTVTIWVGAQYNFGGNNYEVKLSLPEASPSPGAVTPAPPSFSPSPTFQHSSSCETWAYATPPSSPSPAAALTTTVTPSYTPDGYAGSLLINSKIHLSWRVLPATSQVTFVAWVPLNTWMGFAVATGLGMLYPTAGVSIIGTPVDNGVNEAVFTYVSTSATGKDVVKGMHTAPITISNYWARYTAAPLNFSMSWTRNYTPYTCEDHPIDPSKPLGMIWAYGTAQAFGAHGTTQRGFVAFNLINPVAASASPSSTTTPSATPTPSVSNSTAPSLAPSVTPSQTASGTPSVTPTVSVTPSVTPSMGSLPSNSSTPSPTPSFSSSQTATGSASPTGSSSSTASATSTATSTGTSTPTPSTTSTVSPTASITPSVSATASPSEGYVAPGGDPLSGDVMIEDIRVQWRVDPSAKLIHWSVSHVRSYRVWLTISRASSNSMIWPEAGLAPCGIPGPLGSGPEGGQIKIVRMNGYTLDTFQDVPLADSGVTNAVVVFDGTKTVFNYTRRYEPLGDQTTDTAMGDLAIDPSLSQGYLYARGFTETFDDHEVFGFRMLRLQAAAPGQACPAVQCNYHGTCNAADASCTCDTGYAGETCNRCDPLFSKVAGAGGNFTCAVKQVSVRSKLSFQASADTDVIGTADSALRFDVSRQAVVVMASAANVTRDRVVVTVVDAVPHNSSGGRLLEALMVNVTVSIGPTADGGQTSGPSAITLLKSVLGDSSSDVAASMSRLGITVDAESASAARVQYTAEAAPSLCGNGGMACDYPLAVPLGRNMAMAWRIDRESGVIHVQAAFVVRSVSERTWYGIAFDDDPDMEGGDSFAVEPGRPVGQQVTRYVLNGKTMATCPEASDDTVLPGYSSMIELTGLGDKGSSPYAAVRALPVSPSPGNVITVATFSRRLKASPRSDIGNRDVQPGEMVITWAWGPTNALLMGVHTAAMSGNAVIDLNTGRLVHSLSLNIWLLALHAGLLLAGLAVLLPVAVLAVTIGRRIAAMELGAKGVASPYAWWRRAFTQTLQASLACAVAGVAVGIIMTPPWAQWQSAHSQLGLAVLVLYLALAGVAWLYDYSGASAGKAKPHKAIISDGISSQAARGGDGLTGYPPYQALAVVGASSAVASALGVLDMAHMGPYQLLAATAVVLCYVGTAAYGLMEVCRLRAVRAGLPYSSSSSAAEHQVKELPYPAVFEPTFVTPVKQASDAVEPSGRQYGQGNTVLNPLSALSRETTAAASISDGPHVVPRAFVGLHQGSVATKSMSHVRQLQAFAPVSMDGPGQALASAQAAAVAANGHAVVSEHAQAYSQQPGPRTAANAAPVTLNTGLVEPLSPLVLTVASQSLPGALSTGAFSPSFSTPTQQPTAQSAQPSATHDQHEAALALQRVARGWKARRLVKGWTRVVDADGDIYWFDARTGTSSWYPPGQVEATGAA